MKKLMRPGLALLAPVLFAWSAYGCGEQTPTGVSEGLLPVSPATVELRLPWDEFATDLEIHGNFGLPSDLGSGVLARNFRGELQARTLGTWFNLDLEELVEDTTGTLVPDPDPFLVGGRIVLFFDTLQSTPATPVTVSAYRLLAPFDPRTATWEMAVDSLEDRVAWPESGGGPALRVSEAVWDRAEGDSLILHVDSTTVRAWTDPDDPEERNFRLDVDTDDARIVVSDLHFEYDVVPRVRPDTTLLRAVFPTALTFIYTPVPGPPASGLRVGGVPSWRSIIHMDVPKVLDGPPEFCAVMGCPFELRPERINHASLVLRTRPSDPPAFQPSDTVDVDVRPVLAPERLPKSPLGPSIAGPFGRSLSATAFNQPLQVAIPITSFVRAQVDSIRAGEVPPPRALALLTFPEPASIAFGSFAGPGEAGAPYLRLILTRSPAVGLP